MIAIVGSSNFDIVFKVAKFTEPGQTQRALELHYFPGGKGANQAVTVAKLSKERVFFLTCIGSDQFGAKLKEIYEQYNIYGYVIADANNGLAFIELNERGENRIVAYSGANSFLTLKVLNEKLNELRKASLILVQNEIPIDTTLQACVNLHDEKRKIIFDPAPANDVPIDILRYIDFITPNDNELRTLSLNWFGKELSEKEFYERIALENPDIVLVCKKGDKGACAFSKYEYLSIPALKVQAIDTTAAGDVFNGAFAVSIAESKSLEESLMFAVIASGISVTRFGAQTSIPERNEVDKFLNNYNIF